MESSKIPSASPNVYLLGKQKEKAEAAVNEKAYDKALSLAGWKGYVTSLS
ncbi:hypothetical protein CIP107524_02033 [Corynebacterium diphtheriae]|nr:hypothetical protein CIP107524_02033 [Corynebacterium diphtheriae]